MRNANCLEPHTMSLNMFGQSNLTFFACGFSRNLHRLRILIPKPFFGSKNSQVRQQSAINLWSLSQAMIVHTKDIQTLALTFCLFWKNEAPNCPASLKGLQIPGEPNARSRNSQRGGSATSNFWLMFQKPNKLNILQIPSNFKRTDKLVQSCYKVGTVYRFGASKACSQSTSHVANSPEPCAIETCQTCLTSRFSRLSGPSFTQERQNSRCINCILRNLV